MRAGEDFGRSHFARHILRIIEYLQINPRAFVDLQSEEFWTIP